MALYITGIGGGTSKQYWTDQNSNPRLFICEDSWSLLCNSGRWNAGNWQSTLDTYTSQRAAQGYTAVLVMVFSGPQPGNPTNSDGTDWDGLAPFTTAQNPSSGMNGTFWARRDYLVNSAATQGLTVVFNLTTTTLSSDWVSAWTTTQWTDYGTAIGNRYKTMPNILWHVGDDYFGTSDTGLTAMLTALRATGDTHPLSIMNMQETTSRYAFNPTHAADPNSFDVNAQFDWVYTYNPSYNGVTYAQQFEPSGTDVVQGPVPVMWCDGFYLNSSVGAGQTDQRLERQNIWWALSSGACGVSTGDNNIWTWDSGSAAAVTSSFYTTVMSAIINAYSGLPGWQNLVADYSSALVTSGRGTRAADVATGSNGYINNTDAYVTASKTPDGSLAVIYCGKAFSITVNQALLTPGYGAYWLDPLTGTKTTATAGSSYNSAAPGNNSAGDPDWVLVLAAPPYATWPVP